MNHVITMIIFDPLSILFCNYRPGSIVIDYDVNIILFNSSKLPRKIGEWLKNTTLQLETTSTLGDFPLTPNYITTTTIVMLQTGKFQSSVC